MFVPGAVTFGGAAYRKMIEVDYATRAVLFEATVTAPIAPYGMSFHRVERLPLYPPD